MTHFRLRWRKRGEHIHVRMFSASHERDTFANNGLMVLHESEWESFLRCFNDHGADKITVLPEDGEP